MIKVVLLYDVEGWVLQSIAREVKTHVFRAGVLQVEIRKAPETAREFQSLTRHVNVVHFLSPWSFFRWGQLCNRPVVVTVHHLTEWSNRLLKECASHADVFCASNEPCLALLKSLGYSDAPVFLTRYGLDTARFRPFAEGRRRLLDLTHSDPSDILLGVATRISSDDGGRKGLDRYWRLMTVLQEQFAGRVKLIVFGPESDSSGGWSNERIPEAIRSGVILLGYVPEGVLPVVYSGLDYYVCLSRIEGGPYPVMECMACGVKTISTEVGVVPELISDERTGFIVREADYLTRIPAIIREWSHDTEQSLALRRAAREAVVAQHAWPAVATPDWFGAIYACAASRWRDGRRGERRARAQQLSQAARREVWAAVASRSRDLLRDGYRRMGLRRLARDA